MLSIAMSAQTEASYLLSRIFQQARQLRRRCQVLQQTPMIQEQQTLQKQTQTQPIQNAKDPTPA